MKKISIRTWELNSMSVHPEEVTAVQLDTGEEIWCKGKCFSWNKPVALIVDRLGWKGITPRCTMIRQVLEIESPTQIWKQDAVFDPDRVVKNTADGLPPSTVIHQARVWAKNREYPLIAVPGGIIPLVKDGDVAIPDFSMSGTKWRIVPWSDLEKAIPGAFSVLYSASNEEE